MKHSILLIIPLLVMSCYNSRNKSIASEEIVFGDGTKSEAIQSRISDISYLSLETNDSTMFSVANKVLFRDGVIYLGDYTNGRICVFDSKGKCNYVINSQGRGPGEYIMIQSFTVDDLFIDVMDLMQKKLFRYDKKSGHFSESLDLTVYAHDIEALGNGDFIFNYAPLEGAGKPAGQSLHRVFITDSKLKIKNRMIEYSEGKHDLIGGLHYFSTSDDRISLFSYQDDSYYVFDRQDGRLLEKVHIAFSNPIPEGFKSDMSSLSSGYSFIISSPFFCKNYVSFMAKVGEGGGLYEYDFVNDTLFSNSEHETGCFLFNIVGTYEGVLVGLFNNSSTFYDAIVENKGFKKADPASEAAILKDDPVLLFYALK